MAMVDIHHNKLEKIGDGIISFEIKDDFYNHTSVFINQKTKKNVGFSWIQVCKFKPPTLREEFIGALRHSIDDQIQEFKNNLGGDLICDFCKSIENPHIDHVYTFKNILIDFQDIYDVNIPKKYGKCIITNRTIFLEEDSELSINFQRFHKEKAILRCLCSKCNLGRKRK
tara:strand:+ start:7424 stop:7933 length:510 start_codon:yes stop_codon:yes gene_type:complete